MCFFWSFFYCENIEIGGNCLCYFDEFILLIYSNKRKNFIDKILNMNVRRRHYFWMEMVYPKTQESATLFQLFNSINFFSSIINKTHLNFMTSTLPKLISISTFLVKKTSSSSRRKIYFLNN